MEGEGLYGKHAEEREIRSLSSYIW